MTDPAPGLLALYPASVQAGRPRRRLLAPEWIAAYQQALKRGLPPVTAAQQADQEIRP